MHHALPAPIYILYLHMIQYSHQETFDKGIFNSLTISCTLYTYTIHMVHIFLKMYGFIVIRMHDLSNRSGRASHYNTCAITFRAIDVSCDDYIFRRSPCTQRLPRLAPRRDVQTFDNDMQAMYQSPTKQPFREENSDFMNIAFNCIVENNLRLSA